MSVPRRTLLAGLAAAPLLAACGPPSPPGGSQSSGGDAFSYTDARGTRVDLESPPTTVVAQSSAAAALWDAGFQVKGAYGELQTTGGKLGYQAGSLDLSRLTVLGRTYGQFDLEKLAALAPSLLIDLSFDDKTLWYVDAKTEQKVKALCPTLGVPMLGRNLVQVIESFTDLAVRLGADPAASAGAKSRFAAAAEKVRSAASGARGATIAALSFDSSAVYVGNPRQNPDLAYLQTLGVSFVDPTSKPNDYFTQISLENLDDYAGDLLFVDARNTYRGYQSQAAWKALPAVKAGRVFPWKAAAPYSYASSVPVLHGVVEAYRTLSGPAG